MSWQPLKPTNTSVPYGYGTIGDSANYGVSEVIRLLNNLDKKLYVIIKKLELLGQPETGDAGCRS